MKSTYLLIWASLTVGNLTGSIGQGLPADDGTVDHKTIDDIILQRAETILLRSILEKIQEDGDTNGGVSSQSDCVTKRQHPGKRLNEDLEKRQHPGRREEEEGEEEEEEEGDYEAVQKRQHPGKRGGDDDDLDSFIEFQKRQHPGKRAVLEQISGHPALLSELSKRQHPGKRFLAFFSKRQHPGKRDPGPWTPDAADADDADAALQQFDKRQHPGKRFWDNSSPDSGSNRPCDVLDPSGCSKTSLLLDLLDNVTKSRVEEKRQHPGKRLAPPEEDLVEK